MLKNWGRKFSIFFAWRYVHSDYFSYFICKHCSWTPKSCMKHSKLLQVHFVSLNNSMFSFTSMTLHYFNITVWRLFLLFGAIGFLKSQAFNAWYQVLAGRISSTLINEQRTSGMRTAASGYQSTGLLLLEHFKSKNMFRSQSAMKYLWIYRAYTCSEHAGQHIEQAKWLRRDTIHSVTFGSEVKNSRVLLPRPLYSFVGR